MFTRAIITSAFASVILGASSGAIAGDRATAPESGTFEALVYIQSASSGCLDKAAFAFVGEMSFGGLSATTQILRALETGSNFAVDSIQTLTVKTGKGTTSQSGTLAWVGKGIGGSWSVTGTFSATITEIDTHDFILQLKEVYTGCSAEDINVSLERVGANQ